MAIVAKDFPLHRARTLVVLLVDYTDVTRLACSPTFEGGLHSDCTWDVDIDVVYKYKLRIFIRSVMSVIGRLWDRLPPGLCFCELKKIFL